jgi:hypothetical protein
VGYTWPLGPDIGISQHFGANPNNGVNPSGGHTGTDFAAPPDTPVRAPGDGVIKYAQWTQTANGSDNPWWLTTYGGICVVLDCGEVAFVFAHLDRTDQNVGNTVKQGDIIAYTGNTGTATTGPHLHFEALPDGWDFNNGCYGRVDPATYCDSYWGVQASVGLASTTITPITPTTAQEDDLAAVSQESWDNLCKLVSSLVDNAATKADLGDLPREVWAYTNPNLGGGDAYQFLRDGAKVDPAALAAAIPASIAQQVADELGKRLKPAA